MPLTRHPRYAHVDLSPRRAGRGKHGATFLNLAPLFAGRGRLAKRSEAGRVRGLAVS
jgi:hypothetical protein